MYTTINSTHTTINSTQFQSTMLDRTSFSIEAIELLWDYYSSLEEDLGESIAFDPVAIRCEWSEEDAAEVAMDYPDQLGLDPAADAGDIHDLLTGHTTSLGVTPGNKVLYMPW